MMVRMNTVYKEDFSKTAYTYFDNETDEYIVKFYVRSKHQKDADYFTNDKDDALRTAQYFCFD